jgi:ligand-binding sensor domain-containing protein
MKSLLIIILILPSSLLFSQIQPDSYKLLNDGKIEKTLGTVNPLSNSISDIIARNDTVWLGTTKGVSLSTDNGENWTNFYGNAAFGSESVPAVAYDKFHNVLWASTAHSKDVSGSTLPEGSGLHYTTDNGITWYSVPQPLDNQEDSTIVYGINDGIQLPKVRALPVTVAIQNLVYDIAFTPDAVWIATFAGGLRKSTDMGQTWQRVLLPSDSLNSISPNDTIRFALSPSSGNFGTGWLNHRVFSVVAKDDSTLYVGTANGINKSTDGGISWRKYNHLNQENAISGNFIVALGYNPVNNSVWGATWKAEGYTEYYGISYSTDDGDDWQVVLPHEQAHNFGFKDDQPMAATDDGVFRSSNMGSTWILPGSIVDYKTKGTLKTTAFYSAAASGNTIWLGSDQGLARLQETGSMWSGEWKVYIAAPESKEVYAFPNPFAPKIDNKITFKYDTGDQEENVTIRIFDFGMNYLKTVIQNAPRKISPSDPPYDSWDGTDDNGSLVPNGVYFYRIEVGSKDPLFGKILVLQ